MKRTGLYFLVGPDPNDPSDELVYVGESDNVWKRLVNHNSNSSKEFWTRTVVITVEDEKRT